MIQKTSLLLFLLIGTMQLLCQNSKKLFSTDSILNLTIEMPIKDVINDLVERKEHAARLFYVNTDGSKMEHKIKVMVRGKTRAKKATCKFPPLELNFKKKELEGSVFTGQNKLKLVTHCKSADSFEEYIKREYTVYKLYQHISPVSFNVRLCKITYVDLNGKSKTMTHYGFLIEGIKDVAKRNGMEVFKEPIRNQEVLNKDELDKLALFQFMIGNLDWSIPKRHNMKIVKKTSAKDLPTAVPYDFDYSGMVDTPYAIPPEGLEISNVKSRVFRGLCRELGYGTTIQYFKTIQNELNDELNNASYLSDNSKDDMIDYLNSFYKLLNDLKYIDKNIDKACRAKHKHIYEYN